jgi:Domain of unknown function (DUF4383)
MTTKNVAMIFGLAFAALGILAYFPNPLIGDSGSTILYADTFHNIFHLVTGALFILVAIARTGVSSSFMKGFGFIYLALGIWGLVKFGIHGSGELLGFLQVNGADNILYAGIGFLIFVASFIKPKPIPEL